MRKAAQILNITVVFVILIAGSLAVRAEDNVFGIKIEQKALDVLTSMAQRLKHLRSSADLQQALSIKAKIIASDVFKPDVIADMPDMVFWTHMEILKTAEGLVSVTLRSNFGDLQFLAGGADPLCVLLEDGVFARVNIPEILPASLILPEDDSGLFTLINLLGGVPLGSFFRQLPTGGVGADLDIGFVEEIEPSELRAIIRYRGLNKTDRGMVHVVTVGSTLYRQYIKIWVLSTSFDLYQISIEDERGTEVFVVFDKIDTTPLPPEATLVPDISGLIEIGRDEFVERALTKIISSPAINNPSVTDFYVSHDPVARTGTVTVSSDGFDLQDNEDQLICQMEYKSPSGSWTPLATEYAGIAPVGHWNANFAPGVDAELGMYSFRVRYIDSAGNVSDWLECPSILRVTPEPPRVVKTTPASDERKVPVSAKISVTFSKPMDRNSVESAFSMTSGSGRIIYGSFAWEGDTLIFSPTTDLEYNTSHLVRVAGSARDAEGIGLDGNYDTRSDGEYYDDYVWGFVTAESAPTLAFAPANVKVYKGDRFDIRVLVKNVVGMYKFSFKVSFSPKFLEVEKVAKESFWRPGAGTAQETDLWKGIITDNSAGFVTIACDGTRRGGVSGASYIATLSFKCVSAGETFLAFQEAWVSDADGQSVALDLRRAEIKASEFHPLDTNHDGVVDIHDLAGSIVQSAPPSSRFELGQNYPNPPNPETWIPYELAKPSYVTVKIYGVAGELVRTLDLGYKEAGRYKDKAMSAYWDGTDDNGQKVSSGVYFYTIRAGDFTATRKMVICR